VGVPWTARIIRWQRPAAGITLLPAVHWCCDVQVLATSTKQLQQLVDTAAARAQHDA
jgi:hypothetical protein